MNLAEAVDSLDRFIKKHKSEFYDLPKRETALFEIVGIVATAEKLRKSGFAVEVQNLQNAKFKVKVTSSGNPNNFSHFRCSKGGRVFEIHGNLMVKGAHDEGVYCVDVAIVTRNSIPSKIVNLRKWKGIENRFLVSFAEMKRMVAFPMLLAQFIGIVHEIKPRYLRARSSGAPRKCLVKPALMVQRYSSPNCKAIVANFEKRGISIDVNPEIAMMLRSNELDDEL